MLGWSDGGIEALLLGIRHPAKVKKIAAMAANLEPGDAAIYPEVLSTFKSMMDAMPAAARATPEGRRALKAMQMLFDEPHIAAAALEAITAPTLVLAGDHDLIRDGHTLEIYQHLPNGQLCIFPDATHMIPSRQSGAFQRGGGPLLQDALREEGPRQGPPHVLREAGRRAAEEVGPASCR